MPTSQDLIPVDDSTAVRALNDSAFARVLRTYPAIFIRTVDAASWRPCNQAILGTLVGLEHLGELRALVTDGCVAWFVDRIGTLTHGHVAHFIWLAPAFGRESGAPPQPFSVERATSRREEGSGASRHPNASGEHRRRNGKSTTFSLAMELLK